MQNHFGAIHYLFDNAGYQGEFCPTHRYPTDDFARVIEINVVGAFNVLRAVSRTMVEERFGRIVITASRAAMIGPPNMIAYGSSKAAILGMTKTAAKDLAPYNIRVNAISPGLIGPGKMWDGQVHKQAEAGSQYFPEDPEEVEAQMLAGVPMRRLGSLDEVAAVVEFLMSDQAGYVSGVNVPITGGTG